AMVDNELWIGAPFSEGREGRIFRADINEMGGIDAMVKMGSDSIGPNSTFGTLFTVSGNTVAVGMPGDAQGAGTVAFMSRSQSGDWTVIATVFPTAGDQLAAITGREVNCGDDGKAGAFECGNASLLSFMPLADLGVRRGVRLNDNWGWTDPETDREYALVGRTDGTSFVDVTDPTA